MNNLHITTTDHDLIKQLMPMADQRKSIEILGIEYRSILVTETVMSDHHGQTVTLDIELTRVFRP
jgi:hypothetical protein